MRRLCLVPLLALTACSPLAPPGVPAPAVPLAAPETPEASAVAEGDGTPVSAPRWVRTERSGIAVEAVVFDARSHRLRIADQAGGPGSQWPDCRAAGRSLGGIAATNAGFFTPDGQPLGRVTVDGRERGAVNRASSLGSGFWVEAEGRPALIRRERFDGARQALQSGPFLVEGGHAVGGLSPRQSTARTFLATDGRSAWILARTGACSLEQLGRALSGGSIGGVRIETALNLDGGRSSEIWVSRSVLGGPAFVRPIWNKPVRNYLVLVPRS